MILLILQNMKVLKLSYLKSYICLQQYILEKFNSLTQDKSETYSQFSTRLMSLFFDYYVESRKVSQSYDKLIDLIVYDRVKSCLSFEPSFVTLCLVT